MRFPYSERVESWFFCVEFKLWVSTHVYAMHHHLHLIKVDYNFVISLKKSYWNSCMDARGAF